MPKTRNQDSHSDVDTENIEHFDIAQNMKNTAKAVHDTGDKIYDTLKEKGQQMFSRSRDVVEESIRPPVGRFGEAVRDKLVETEHEAEQAIHSAYARGTKWGTRTYRRWSRWMHQRTSAFHRPMVAVVLGVMWFAFAAWMNYQQGLIEAYSRDVSIIDSRFYALPKTINYVLGALGPIGRSKYAAFLKIDYFFAFFLSAWLSISMGNVTSSPELVALPMLEFLFDFLEGTLIQRLISIYPRRNLYLELLTTLCVTAKWVALFCSLALLFIGTTSRTVSWVTGKQRPQHHRTAYHSQKPKKVLSKHK